HYMDVSNKKNDINFFIKPEKINVRNVSKDITKEKEENKNEKGTVSNKNMNAINNNNFDFLKIKNLMLIRYKNTMIEALKTELTKEQDNLQIFNDYTFDQ